MKILIILASGIGNSILFSPTLRELRKNFPQVIIDIIAYKNPFVEPFKESNLVNNIYNFYGSSTILKLRKNKYDISITAFPSNKWQFNMFAFLVGAKRRITHSYKVGNTFAFLQNVKVPADEKLHDVEQNLNLLNPLKIKLPKKPQLYFHISEENKEFAKNFIKKNKLNKKYIIGVHPGSGPLDFKRAPIEKFVELIKKYHKKRTTILIFGGLEEKIIKDHLGNILRDLNYSYIFIEESLKNTATLIRKCNVFITNDTGLMHIASTSLITKVIALFHGTNPTRTRPYTKNAEVIILRKNKLKYPFWSTRAEEG